MFLAWFKRESDKPIDNIRLVLEDVSNARVSLLISAISFTEVLDTQLAPDVRSKFKSFARRSNVEVANVDVRVAELAAEFRERNSVARATTPDPQKPPKLKTPDALIAATAVLYGVDVLHTFDPGLLSHNGSPIVDGLKITPPMTIKGQTSLYASTGTSATPDDYSDEPHASQDPPGRVTAHGGARKVVKRKGTTVRKRKKPRTRR